MSKNRQNRNRPKKVVQIEKKATKKKEKPMGLLGYALRGLGGLGGAAIGGLVGAPSIGSSVGSSFGGAISKWLGAGDYTVARNTIIQRASANIPMMHNTGQSITVRHREFVGTINGSTGFQVQKSYTINPGVAATFPWLATIASRFQEYEFKGLVFHYVPTSGTFNGSSAALGAVMIQTTYRSTDTPPNNKLEMLNEYCSNETVPFDTMVHPIECDPKENPFSVHYVRSGPIPSGEPLMYDVGTTFVATQGMSTTDVVGDLWVTYEVELKKPLVSSPVVTSSQYFSCTYRTPTTSSFFSGTQDNVGGSLPVTATSKTITLPPRSGTFYVAVEIFSTGLTHATAVQWTGALTLVNLSPWAYDGIDSSSDSVYTGTTVTANSLRYIVGVQLTDSTASGTITFPNAQWSSGSTTRCGVVVFASN